MNTNITEALCTVFAEVIGFCIFVVFLTRVTTKVIDHIWPNIKRRFERCCWSHCFNVDLLSKRLFELKWKAFYRFLNHNLIQVCLLNSNAYHNKSNNQVNIYLKTILLRWLSCIFAFEFQKIWREFPLRGRGYSLPLIQANQHSAISSLHRMFRHIMLLVYMFILAKSICMLDCQINEWMNEL